MTCSLEIRLRTTGALAYATNASAHSSSTARIHSALVRRLGRSPRTSRANLDGDGDATAAGSGVSTACWLEATRETEEREKSHASERSSKQASRGTSVTWFTNAKFPPTISINCSQLREDCARSRTKVQSIETIIQRKHPPTHTHTQQIQAHKE